MKKGKGEMEIREKKREGKGEEWEEGEKRE
jgi:hypothetical protein